MCVLLPQAHEASPPGAEEYLAKAREAYRLGRAVLLAINNTFSYGHRVLDRLLRAKGEDGRRVRAGEG